jgi:hypothetical protein
MTTLTANQKKIFKYHMFMLLPEPTPKVNHIYTGPPVRRSSFLTFVKGGHCESGTELVALVDLGYPQLYSLPTYIQLNSTSVQLRK